MRATRRYLMGGAVAAAAIGTPMPLAPTEHLVVTGFNRYVRNPM